MESFRETRRPRPPYADWHRMEVFKLNRTPPYASWQVTVPLVSDDLAARLLRIDFDQHELEELFDEIVLEADELLAKSDAGPIGLTEPGVTFTSRELWFDFELEMPDSELAGRHGRWVRETVDRAIARMAGRVLVTLDSPDATQLKTALLA